MSEMLVSVGILSQLALYLKSIEIDLESLFASVGIDASLLRSPDAQIPFDEYVALEDRAAELSRDPYFGLHMGEFVQPGHYGIIGFMMMNSSQLGEAMTKMGRYNRLIGTVISGRVALGINKVRLILSAPADSPRLSRHCVECAAASLITLARRLTGTEVNPLAVTFESALPENDAEYRRVFRCPVAFGRRENALVLDPGVGSIPLPSPNPELLAYFEDYARSYLEEIELSGTVSTRVTKILLSRLDCRNVRLRDIAGMMGVSTRTLQKRLEEEGVVFRDLLLATRKNLAAKYLRERRTIEEISYLLGYSEAGAFSKAFKKWYGLSPRTFRNTVGTEPA